MSADRIARGALQLIDAEGLGALSARKLAAVLGCEAMSLYHHVDGMDGVLDGVVDTLLGSLLDLRPKPRNPRAALISYAHAYLDLAEAHPDAMVLVGTRRWRTPRALAAAAAGIDLVSQMGVSPRAALKRMRVFGAYLNGAALALTGWRRAGAEASGEPGSNPTLQPLASALNARAVRTDLEAGLELLLDALV